MEWQINVKQQLDVKPFTFAKAKQSPLIQSSLYRAELNVLI